MSDADRTESNGMAVVPRTRRGKKRLVFQPPRNVPRSVRSLWEAAGPEERTKAHTTCIAVLSMWLGRKSRSQVAAELGLPPLRVWQLSQAALSGMLAGLLKQPRSRGGERGAMTMSGEEDPRVLKQRIRELEEENRSLRELLEVIKSLPSVQHDLAQRTGKKSPKPESAHGRKKAVRHRGEASGGSASAAEGPAAPR
jgi:hypothetical protein